MKNRKWLLLVALVLSVAMATTGTLAYLTDDDADVNTMTLGKVEIVQNEQEWNADETALQQFTQDKPLLPYVGKLGWENKDEANGAYRRFTMSNVVDKYVTVTNTGKSDAYVRTIIALEMGDYTYTKFANIIGASINKINGDEFKFPGAWEWTHDFVAKIDGRNYNIMVAVHKDVVAPGETTIPSLLQVYLSKDADNEAVEKLDGNGNGKYDILVLSQAIQATGFEGLGEETGVTGVTYAKDAAYALNEGFGDVTAANVAEWFSNLTVGSPGDKNGTNNPPSPFAKVTVLDADNTLTNADGDVTVVAANRTIDTTRSNMGLDVGEIPLDVLYQFEPTISAEEVKNSEYRYWHADFVVSVDKDIPAYGIGLAGYYDAWCSLNNDKWVMLAVNDEIEAGTQIRLVESMGNGSITVNYEELCQYGNDGIGFLCGAVALADHEEQIGNVTPGTLLPGTTLTVELRLYETEEPSAENGNSKNVETGEYITTGVYKYTFN